MIQKIAINIAYVIALKLAERITPKTIRAGLVTFADWAEDAVKKTPNQVDDLLVMPLIDALRNAAGEM